MRYEIIIVIMRAPDSDEVHVQKRWTPEGPVVSDDEKAITTMPRLLVDRWMVVGSYIARSGLTFVLQRSWQAASGSIADAWRA